MEAQIKSLAHQVQDAVWRQSAGEMSRRRGWGFFVKNLPNDYNLMELADACFEAMSTEQKSQFLAKWT